MPDIEGNLAAATREFACFTVICGIYAVSFWLRSILKADGVTDTMQIGLYSMIGGFLSPTITAARRQACW